MGRGQPDYVRLDSAYDMEKSLKRKTPVSRSWNRECIDVPFSRLPLKEKIIRSIQQDSYLAMMTSKNIMGKSTEDGNDTAV